MSKSNDEENESDKTASRVEREDMNGTERKPNRDGAVDKNSDESSRHHSDRTRSEHSRQPADRSKSKHQKSVTYADQPTDSKHAHRDESKHHKSKRHHSDSDEKVDRKKSSAESESKHDGHEKQDKPDRSKSEHHQNDDRSKHHDDDDRRKQDNKKPDREKSRHNHSDDRDRSRHDHRDNDDKESEKKNGAQREESKHHHHKRDEEKPDREKSKHNQSDDPEKSRHDHHHHRDKNDDKEPDQKKNAHRSESKHDAKNHEKSGHGHGADREKSKHDHRENREEKPDKTRSRHAQEPSDRDKNREKSEHHHHREKHPEKTKSSASHHHHSDSDRDRHHSRKNGENHGHEKREKHHHSGSGSKSDRHHNSNESDGSGSGGRSKDRDKDRAKSRGERENSSEEAERETMRSWEKPANTLRDECLTFIKELEDFERADVNVQLKNYQIMIELLDAELPKYVQLSMDIQKEIDVYEDEKLRLAKELHSIYVEAVRQRQLKKALEARRRHMLLLQPAEEVDDDSYESMSDRVTREWKESVKKDVSDALRLWEDEEEAMMMSERMLKGDYEKVSAEYYQVKGLQQRCEREMLEARDQFKDLVEGYQTQLETLKSKMLEIIKRERARHYHLQECLQKRQSERETRYQVLRDTRHKVIAATYAIHNKLANYVTLIRKRWLPGEEQLWQLANTEDGEIEVTPDTQKLIAELLLYNPQRIDRIRGELENQIEGLRLRLADLLQQVTPLMRFSSDEADRPTFDAKLDPVDSEDSGFELTPMDHSELEDSYERERHFLDFLGGSVELEQYSQSLAEKVNLSYTDDDAAALNSLVNDE